MANSPPLMDKIPLSSHSFVLGASKITTKIQFFIAWITSCNNLIRTIAKSITVYSNSSVVDSRSCFWLPFVRSYSLQVASCLAVDNCFSIPTQGLPVLFVPSKLLVIRKTRSHSWNHSSQCNDFSWEFLANLREKFQ